MAVTIDIGEWNDIHPLNKKEVGHRLALQARNIAYNENLKEAETPWPQKMTVIDNKAVITFTNIGNGLAVYGDELKYFALSENGEHFTWAKAKLVNNSIHVWHEDMDDPRVVRYAWANNPKGANLYTKDGIPVSPFEIRHSSLNQN